MKQVTINNNRMWVDNGRLHNTEGPAVENADGSQEWWVHGLRHREDGPAIERPSGHHEWYINHRKYWFDEWCKELDIAESSKVMYILQYGR